MEIDELIKEGRLDIIVKPNSAKTKISGWDESRHAIKIDVKAKPENNMANIELIKFFSKKTGMKVHIVSGLTSKKKTLRFEE